ncbi:ADAM-TS Spacer 1 [Popillia japonica]|uniref:ADAM-TS Spacer 1 n=1 Tax=Popillia japonica TaxID=7064 RepID=A0AAW1N6Q1_POPJA
MSPSIHRKRTFIVVSTVVAIVLLVIFIVVLWVLQGSGAFYSSEKRRSNSTLLEGDRGDDDADISRKWVYGGTHNDSDVSISSEHHYTNNPNVQFVTPFKISPQPLHHHDLIYDQLHNETTAETTHHSGHFRHKTAEIWDPHPEYEIVAFGKKLHLILELNDDIPKNIHITHIYGNYSRRIEHDPRTSGCYYKGTIKGDANSSVSVNLCHGMTGHIYTSTGNYYIVPVENSTGEHLLSTLKHKMIKETYKTDDNSNTDNNNISHCEEKIVIDDDFLPYSDTSHERSKREVLLFDDVDNFDDISENFESRRWIRGTNGRRKSAVRTKRTDHEYFIEVLVVADKSMVIYHKDRDTLIQYILILMSHVGILFKDATVEFAHNRSDQMLKSFCEWQRDHNNHIRHDASILLTRNFICKNVSSGICHTLGIAEVGGMCSESSSCAIVKDNGLSSSYTIAHEMGHLLNMRHDDYHQCMKYNGGSKSNIMSKMLQNDTKPWQWSACSRHYLTEFLDSPRAYCLLGKPKDTKLEFTNTLPGENFEVDRQCELEFGVGSKICSFMGTCSSLWCTSEAGEEDNGCRTQHMPWADGTRCDNSSFSWCHHGKCIKVDRRSLAPRNGIWGPWQAWGSCSRTCGGGIKIRIRECNQPPPANGGSYCTGQSTSYASCNTQQCPTGTHDFREDQCAEFDGYTKGIAGLTSEVKWVPKYGITEQQDLCRLFCRVKGTNEYYRLKDKVVDGTKCTINSFDICVNGKCLPGGCDNALNSTLTLDECGVCNGDNSTCQEVLGRYNTSTRGYTRVVRIPKGSSNIVIEQLSYRILDDRVWDDNYLSLVDGETGEYVLNGNFVTSSFKRDLVYGGLTITYSGSHSRIERITTPKNRKLSRDLVLEVLAATGTPPDIRYRYTINKEMAPKYGWQLYQGNWTECNSICRGIQYIRPVCLDLVNYTQVHGSKCSDLSMEGLVRERQCNMYCKLAWNVTKSGSCSVHCGHGWQEVNFNCVKIDLTVPNGGQHAVDDMHCSNIPRSSSSEPCKGPCDATHWQYSPWSQCSRTCGGGIKTRTAKCVDGRNNTIDDSHCHAKDKYVRHTCNHERCPMWTYEDWTACSTPCGKGYRTKKYYCSLSGQIVNEDMCNPKELKIPQEECEMMSCQWYIGNWTLCSVSCGDGIRIREVECRAGSRKVHANLCRELLRPVNKTSCSESPCEIFEITRYSTKHDNDIPNDMYYNSYYTNYKWEVVGRWSECSRSCAAGTKSRQVVCRDRFGRENELQCDNGEKPEEYLSCNEFECPTWRTGEWSKCNAFCQRSRRVGCFDHTHAMAHPQTCNQTVKPEENIPCKSEECHRNRITPASRTKPQQQSDESKKNHRYRWKKTGWTPCSNSCGKGTRTRKVNCRDTLGNVSVVDGYCQGTPKPKQIRFCQHYNKHNCTFTWVDGPWSKCSKSCGEGIRYRNVTCQRVFTGGIIQEGVISSKQKCDPHMKPAISERCQERTCNDPYMWRADAWSKCNDTCGTRDFQSRRLHCVNQRGQKLAKKLCRKIRRPERKRRCPVVYCSSCREIQRQMKTKENKEHFLNLHGKLAPIHCYKMDTDHPEEYISLQGSKENYVQYYDYRIGKLSQTNFWKIRLNTTDMKLIQNDTIFSESNSTRSNYGQAGTNDLNLNRYVYFVIDMSDTTFRLADSVRWVCTETHGHFNVDIQNNGQLVRGICAPNCGVCMPDPDYGLPVEIT